VSRKLIVSGCYFEPDESEVPKDPIVGKKSGTISEEPKLYRRKSILDDVPDDFAARMMGFKPADRKDKNVDVKTPEGFAVLLVVDVKVGGVMPIHLT
jgi:hypothetical protein